MNTKTDVASALSNLKLYEHSGKFSASSLFYIILFLAPISFLLGAIYAHLVSWCPFIYINILITMFYGASVGAIAGLLLSSNKVRNTGVVWLVGVCAAVLAIYANWCSHLNMSIQSDGVDTAYFQGIDGITVGLSVLRDNYVIKIHNANVTGYGLVIIWIIETVIIAISVIFTAIASTKDTPFCEESNKWLDETKSYKNFRLIDSPSDLEGIKNGHLQSLLKYKKESGSSVDASFTNVIINYSGESKTITLRLESVDVVTGKGVDNKKLTKLFIIPGVTFAEMDGILT